MSSASHPVARPSSPMRLYRSRKDAARQAVLDKFNILGFLASGTYGRVYKATIKQPHASAGQIVAIKKFKPDKEGDANGPVYSGISQSACREIMLRLYILRCSLPALLTLEASFSPHFQYCDRFVMTAQSRAFARQCSLSNGSNAGRPCYLHGL